MAIGKRNNKAKHPLVFPIPPAEFHSYRDGILEHISAVKKRERPGVGETLKSLESFEAEDVELMMTGILAALVHLAEKLSEGFKVLSVANGVGAGGVLSRASELIATDLSLLFDELCVAIARLKASCDEEVPQDIRWESIRVLRGLIYRRHHRVCMGYATIILNDILPLRQLSDGGHLRSDFVDERTVEYLKAGQRVAMNASIMSMWARLVVTLDVHGSLADRNRFAHVIYGLSYGKFFPIWFHYVVPRVMKFVELGDGVEMCKLSSKELQESIGLAMKAVYSGYAQVRPYLLELTVKMRYVRKLLHRGLCQSQATIDRDMSTLVSLLKYFVQRKQHSFTSLYSRSSSFGRMCALQVMKYVVELFELCIHNLCTSEKFQCNVRRNSYAHVLKRLVTLVYALFREWTEFLPNTIAESWLKKASPCIGECMSFEDVDAYFQKNMDDVDMKSTSCFESSNLFDGCVVSFGSGARWFKLPSPTMMDLYVITRESLLNVIGSLCMQDQAGEVPLPDMVKPLHTAILEMKGTHIEVPTAVTLVGTELNWPSLVLKYNLEIPSYNGSIVIAYGALTGSLTISVRYLGRNKCSRWHKIHDFASAFSLAFDFKHTSEIDAESPSPLPMASVVWKLTRKDTSGSDYTKIISVLVDAILVMAAMCVKIPKKTVKDAFYDKHFFGHYTASQRLRLAKSVIMLSLDNLRAHFLLKESIQLIQDVDDRSLNDRVSQLKRLGISEKRPAFEEEGDDGESEDEVNKLEMSGSIVRSLGRLLTCASDSAAS